MFCIAGGVLCVVVMALWRLRFKTCEQIQNSRGDGLWCCLGHGLRCVLCVVGCVLSVVCCDCEVVGLWGWSWRALCAVCCGSRVVLCAVGGVLCVVVTVCQNGVKNHIEFRISYKIEQQSVGNRSKIDENLVSGRPGTILGRGLRHGRPNRENITAKVDSLRENYARKVAFGNA